MKINTVAKSRSLEGGILVYNRASNDTWVVMWRTSLARRYRSFKTLAQANYFAAELQRERRMNGAQPTPSLLSADEAKVWHELRVLIGGTPLSEVVEALKERRERMGGRQLEVLVADFLRMRKDEGVRGWLHTNQTFYLRRFVRAIGPLKPGNSIEPDDGRLKKSEITASTSTLAATRRGGPGSSIWRPALRTSSAGSPATALPRPVWI